MPRGVKLFRFEDFDKLRELYEESDKIKRLIDNNISPSTFIEDGELDELCSHYDLDVFSLRNAINKMIINILRIKLEANIKRRDALVIDLESLLREEKSGEEKSEQ